jgi:glycosyltransferase involved in cell wall biosynthesis
MKKLRVAHVITRLCKGGAQENTFHTVRMADRDRYEADLISGPTHGDEGNIEPVIGDAGIDIIREPDLVRAPSFFRDRRALRRLTALFKEKQYDIVHTHTSKAGYIGRMAAHRAGVPVVVHTPHGHIFHGYFPGPITRFFIALERRAARHTDRIIALTQRGVDDHLAQRIGRPEQYAVIHSGIDLSPYASAREKRAETRRELGLEPGDFVVGGVGRLEPVKGFTYLVQAARPVLERLPHARMVLVGDGSLADTLRDEARDLGNRFHFLGLRHDVPDVMAAFDLLVLPSRNEGMGRVLLEAGAAGVPSVATAVGGVPNVVDDGVTGVLVPPENPQALADAVMHLAEDAPLRETMGQSARERVVPNYGLETMVRQIEDLYELLAKEKGL